MLSWFKTKIWQPIKGFFKDLFGITAMENDCKRYVATSDLQHQVYEELVQLYDNLTNAHRELIKQYNKDITESRDNVRKANKEVQESREWIKQSKAQCLEQSKLQKELDQVVETHKKVFSEVLKKLPKTCPNPGHKRRFSIG